MHSERCHAKKRALKIKRLRAQWKEEKMKQYVIDAFTDRLFAGNPAAVCVMDKWPAERLMMNIAAENNLSETAFVVREKNGWHLRWFTPGGEIDLCGHATLATAFALMNYEGEGAGEIRFATLSGELVVVRNGDLYEMDFPAYELAEVQVTDAMEDALGVRPDSAYMGRDLLCVYDKPGIVEGMEPDMAKLLELDGLLCHISEPGAGDYDCVSRSFAPKLNVAEDPVCGSGHCHIAPYWSSRLGKEDLLAYQASKRGGELRCRMNGNHVVLGGKAVLFSVDELSL